MSVRKTSSIALGAEVGARGPGARVGVEGRMPA